MFHTRLITTLLRRHTEVEHVHKHLAVALGLKRPTHDAERQQRSVRLSHEGRNESMKRAFVRFETVRVIRIE